MKVKRKADIQRERARLDSEMEQIAQQLTEARAALAAATAQPTRNEARAESAAAKIVMLEARQRALQADAEKNQQDAAALEAFLKSKGYRNAMHRLVELDAFFGTEAAAVHDVLEGLRERLMAAHEKQAEYLKLLSDYGADREGFMDMERLVRPDTIYLTSWLDTLTREHEREKIARALASLTPAQAKV